MAEYEMDLPCDDESAEGERESQNAFRTCFSRFIPRVPDTPPDRGADGSIELRKSLPQNGLVHVATGKRAWFQLKHTSSPTRLADGSISYPIKTKNINYLGNYPCPFYVLHITSTGELLFRWWRDLKEELDRERPGWNEQGAVCVRFSRLVDEDLLNEIEIEISSYASQVAELFDGPRFIRDIRSEDARRLLDPDPLFFGRARELRMLQERIGRGKIIPIVGPPDSGKRELVRRFLSDSVVLPRLRQSLGGGPVALLVIDVGVHLEPRLLRGLAYGIGVQKSWEIGSDVATERSRERAVLLGQSLPARTQGEHLVAVIENAHHCLSQAEERRDLDDLLASEPFRSGCTAIVSGSGLSPDGKGTRAVQAEVQVGFLPTDCAADLLNGLGVEPALSSSAVALGRQFPEFLLPGVLRRAAARFTARYADGRIVPTSDSLFDELVNATSHLADRVLVEIGFAQDTESRSTLIAMSVLGRRAISESDLHRARLPIPPFRRLCQLGWTEQVDADTYRLTGFGCRSLRRKFEDLAAQEPLARDEFFSVTKVLQRLVGNIAAGLGEEDFAGFAQTIEEATAWTRDSRFRGTEVEAFLLQTLLPYVADDIFFPVLQQSALPVDHVPPAAEQSIELADAAAQLVVAARSGVAFEEFIGRLHTATGAAASSAHLLAVYIRTLDFAAYFGQRRYHRDREILAIRQKLVGRLINLSNVEAADVGVLKWSASWILNTAALAARVGEAQVARTITECAERAVARLPSPKTSFGKIDNLWLTSRLARIESLVQAGPLERLAKLREAADTSFAAMAMAPMDTRWTRFALRAASRLSEELRSDQERGELLDEVYQRLASMFGDDVDWPLGVRAQAMALARDTASYCADPERRLQQLRRWLDLFEPATAQAKVLAQLGDTRALLVLARTLAFAATCHNQLGEAGAAATGWQDAFDMASDALDATPTAAAWELYLHLLDQQESARPELPWHTDPLGSPRFEIGPKLRERVEDAGKWLASISFWDTEHAKLALWCLRRRWVGQGSLERWAARQQDPNSPWDELPHEEKRRLLAVNYHKRQAALDAIERKSGPVLDVFVARLRNEAQFQRSFAIYGNHVFSADAVLRHLSAAEKLWPDSPLLSLENGRFRRYVWDFQGSILALRRVVTTAPTGHIRREATADLVEVLLTAAAHCERVEFDGMVALERAALAAEARVLVGELLGFRDVSHEVAVFRDRADLEVGTALDWDRIDEAFRTVVGDVDAYATTLAANLDVIRAQETVVPERLADLVLADFTDSEVLRGLGSLYLRRADLGASPNATADYRKAYAAFQSCRILEMAFVSTRGESATTSYQRARAILGAVKTTGMLVPFTADLERKQNLLHLAISLFNRAVSLTVGQFHTEAKRCQSEAARLLRLLE